MAVSVAKYAGRKMLKNKMAGSSESWKEKDPYYYWDQKQDKYTGELLFDKKDRPLYADKGHRKDKHYFVQRFGISEHDAEVLAKLKRKAERYDGSPNAEKLRNRYGLSVIIGAVPVVGDTLDTLIALSFVYSAGKVDHKLSAALRLRMLINIGLDFGIGLVPILGDLADAEFRANTRNTSMLEKHLIKCAQVGKTTLKEGHVESASLTDDESHDSPPLHPQRPVRHPTSGSSPHGSTRHQILPMKPSRSENQGFFSDQGYNSQQRPTRDRPDPASRPSRRETPRQTGDQQSRFVGLRDL